MNIKTRNAVVIGLAAALTQLAACSVTPPKVTGSNSGFCMTSHPPLASDVVVDTSAESAMLVDAVGPRFNCASIPQGRYDAEVVAQWSRGYVQTPLQLTNIRLAPGQAVVAKAYERGRGEIRTAFYRVAPSQAPVEAAVAAAPVAMPEPRADESGSMPLPPPEARADGSGMTPTSLLEGTALVVGGAAIAAIYLPYAPVIAIEAMKVRRDERREMIRQERLRPDCCFLWIEDRQTGALIAGSRPPL
jgi:hypothetical protein